MLIYGLYSLEIAWDVPAPSDVTSRQLQRGDGTAEHCGVHIVLISC